MARVILVGLVLSFQPIACDAFGAPLTEWQEQVFSEVESSAAEQSKAAEPELLALFDSKDFRANLSSCCPSLAELTAKELLDRVSKQVEVAEVASGFPADQDPAKMYPDSAGMSIGFGMNGTFFLNDWQAVLMHSSDPDHVWHDLVATYVGFHVNSTKGTVTVEQWFGGCSGNKTTPAEMLLSTCYEQHFSKGMNMIIRYDYEPGQVNSSMWMAGNDSKVFSGWKSPSLQTNRAIKKVDCPKDAAFATQIYVADGHCHIYPTTNNSKQFCQQDHAETDVYAMKPFQSRGAPSTLLEAGERPVYSMVNLNLIDMGSPIYGDVSAVFAQKYILNSTLLSPTDTGLYEMGCLDKTVVPVEVAYNCSALTGFPQLGTLQHNKHLWLINKGFWNRLGLLHTALTRMETPWGRHAVPAGSFLNYFEAALIGQLQFPSAIRFLIGSFPALFGTDMGVRLQAWARSRGWVLIWALGSNEKALPGETPNFNFELLAGHTSFQVNQRMIDPVVLSETTAVASLRLGSNVTDKFKQMWAAVANLRNTTTVTNATVAQKWQETAVLLPQLPIRPLMGGDCEVQLLNAECIGMTLQGGCICYAGTEVTSRQEIVVV
mmetsp:Transcript_55742/g.130676  ORF Transcript_55742/g.130676 Transcript_55742/m.130676 type:complete len:603 (+) Transcript_55742:37-1845(+)